MTDLCDVCLRYIDDYLDECTCPKCRVCGESIPRHDPGLSDRQHEDCWDYDDEWTAPW